ncbi:hypothetical protein HYQ45_008141 [Verticillium longisporum]|uniref:Uncharacterized protein n=1 Tax=Verticillium longisporum TaxID=100787 RepID=A0A8I2ZNU8_VERLO|nr:hypothetical protein HYQ45_008141 [Verticillium longisporum]
MSDADSCMQQIVKNDGHELPLVSPTRQREMQRINVAMLRRSNWRLSNVHTRMIIPRRPMRHDHQLFQYAPSTALADTNLSVPCIPDGPVLRVVAITSEVLQGNSH